MFLSLQEDKAKSLWDLLWLPQRKALFKMVRYIHKFRKELTDQSALVQMPTGSGKSGIIAILSTCTLDIGLTLVLTPRKVIRDQLSNDINGEFFEKIKFKINHIPKRIMNLNKSSKLVFDDSIELEKQVIVMTFNMLLRIAKNKRNEFEILKNRTSLIIVDEGHYEPAITWSEYTRAIKAPKILFTATPYRNDFNVFNINPKSVFSLSFKNAKENGYIRDVSIVERSRKTEPEAFVEDIIDFYNEIFPDPGNDPPRIIIRCDNSDTIGQLAKIFQRYEIPCIGIHENFTKEKGRPEWLRKNVPNPKEERSRVWIHQFKLMEGIDDPRFQVLAIYEPIQNARQLVQQIGRIVRNPNREKGKQGYFLDHWNEIHSHLWDGFLAYDKMIDRYGHKVFYLSTGEGLLSELIKAQPKITYLKGKFRFQLDFSDIDLARDIQIPLRVNILKKLNNFNLKLFVEFVKREYQKTDRVVRVYPGIIDNLYVIISIRYRNSPFLRNHIFLEPDLFITIIIEFKEFLGIYDSSGINWIGFENQGIGHSVNVKKMKNLFSKKEGAVIKKVSLNNSNLGTSLIQSRTITAISIEDTIPSFDDYAQICTTAEGYGSYNGDRRYIGFTRGRISEYKGGYVQLPDYLNWISDIRLTIEGKESRNPVFSRYALEKNVPKETDPRSILLDIEEIKEIYITNDGNDYPLHISDTCAEVNNGRFQIEANGNSIEIEIKFESNKYKLKSSKLAMFYYPKHGSENFDRSIVKYFNRTQSFRVLPKALDTIYVKGQFYSPKMKIGEDFDKNIYALGKSFVPDDKIGKCSSEKGSPDFYATNNTEWDPNSLFGIICKCGNGTSVSDLFENPNIIVCDDMGTEIADFILCDTNHPRIIFIHAKAISPGLKCSASNLHEVCAQTIKNLGYLSMYNDFKPSKLNSWDGQWSSNGCMVINKIFKADTGDNAQDVWRKIHNVINNPVADKEVWLFIGNILSRNHFEKELKKNSPRANVIQAAYLLHGTMSEVASVGAKFRIFCNN